MPTYLLLIENLDGSPGENYWIDTYKELGQALLDAEHAITETIGAGDFGRDADGVPSISAKLIDIDAEVIVAATAYYTGVIQLEAAVSWIGLDGVAWSTHPNTSKDIPVFGRWEV